MLTTHRHHLVPVILLVTATVLASLAAGAAGGSSSEQESAARHGLANPASVHCAKLGGASVIRTRPDGGQYGVCVFEDDRQCEEWALLRGECPEGGIKVTGYDSDAQVFCAITGGEVEMQAGLCIRADGQRCALDANFDGRCPGSGAAARTDAEPVPTSDPSATDR
jgi:hypothetical protein